MNGFIKSIIGAVTQQVQQTQARQNIPTSLPAQPRSTGLLRATYNPDVACTRRCWTAKSKICSCSCGGVNHGKDCHR